MSQALIENYLLENGEASIREISDAINVPYRSILAQIQRYNKWKHTTKKSIEKRYDAHTRTYLYRVVDWRKAN